MSRTTAILLYMMTGALVGVVIASLVVPPFLSWYNEPGAITPGKQIETLCNLPELIRYTATRIFRGQMIGAGVGALLFMFPGIAVARRRVPAAVETTAVTPTD